MLKIDSQEKFADDLVNYTISRVSGTHPEDEVINEKPSKFFLIGTLAARKERDLEDEVKLDDEGKAASIRASRLKVSVLMARQDLELNPEVTIQANGNVYYQIKTKKEDDSKNPSSLVGDSDSQRDKKYQWKRLSYNHQQKLNILSDPEFYVDFSQVRELANSDPLISKPIPDSLWKVKVHVTKTDFNEKDLLISFNYENESREQNYHEENQDQQQELSKQKENEKKFDGFERTIFNCKLEIDVGNLPIKEFCDDYLYEDYKQRYYYDFRTVNCQAKWVEDRRKFVTGHFGKFEQENIRPKEGISHLNLSFSNLMLSEGAFSSLDRFVNEMKKYHETYKNNIPTNIAEDGFQPRVDDREITWKERKDLIKHFMELIDHVEEIVG